MQSFAVSVIPKRYKLYRPRRTTTWATKPIHSKINPWPNTFVNYEVVWFIPLSQYLSDSVSLIWLFGPLAPGFSNRLQRCCRMARAWFLPRIRKGFFLSKTGPGLRHTSCQPGYFLSDLAFCRSRFISSWKTGNNTFYTDIDALFYFGNGLWLFSCFPTGL